MADDKTVTEAEDTGLSETTDTSAAEEKDIDELTFNDLNFDDESETNTTEAEPAEEVEETQTEATDDTEEQSEETEEEERSESSTATAEDKDAEAERKRFNDEMAKRRIAEKQARDEARQAKEALEAEHIRNYLAEAEDDENELAKRQLNVDAYRIQQERISLNKEKLETALDKAVAGIDMFRTGTEAERNALLRAADTFEQLHVVKDDKGNPIDINGDLYVYLQNEANSIRELTQAGAARQTKAKDDAKARTITPPSRAPQEKKVDKDIDDFNKVFGF